MVDDGSTRHNRLFVVAGCFSLFVALRLTIDGVISITASSILTPSIGLAIPLGAVFGFPAVIGLVSGMVVTQLAQVGFSLLVVFDVGAIFVLSAVPAAVWQSQVALWGERTVDIQGVTGLAVLALIASVGGASLFAWGGELLGLFPFYVAVVETSMRYVLATVLVAPAVLLLASLLQRNRSRPSPPTKFGVGFVLLPLLWALLAFVGSLGFNVRERISQFVFEQYGVELLYNVLHPDIFGQGGRRIQVLFGAVMLVAWGVSVVAPLYENSRRSPDESADETDSARSNFDNDGTGVSHPEEMEVR